ncbi:hypothetical protein LX64_04606 [Chitinophaga skermanii]|uniref:Uncharacterized protein n=1 Tax=Chitinophaga skermanii TaxID=331697 RepID=A0A327Q889_9BACT|nr:hypothetical protein [Chitinophaga skermanii]RAI99472.1 hypothetical protein LX64_04606 [Chitinophaga skermanii]
MTVQRGTGVTEMFSTFIMPSYSRIKGGPDPDNTAVLNFVDKNMSWGASYKSGYIGMPNASSNFYVGANQGDIILAPSTGNVNLSVSESNKPNMITYQNNATLVAPPRIGLNNRSLGTKLLLYTQQSAISSDFALGLENSHIWFSTSQNIGSHGFKFYGGEVVAARLSAAGQFETKLAGRFLGEVDPNGAANGAINGPGAEVAFNQGNAIVRGYNRTTSVYLPTQVVGGDNNATAFSFKISDGYYFTNLTNSSMLGTDATGKLVSSNNIIYLDRANNNVGINTTDTKGYKLAVNGNVIANKITVKAYPWADFVFDDNYKLPSLASVEAFIKQHKHLPNIPSAKEVAENGIEVGEMNSKLLQTIEELTLHAIAQEKQITAQKDALSNYQEQLSKQAKLINEQQQAMKLMMEKLEKLLEVKQ